MDAKRYWQTISRFCQIRSKPALSAQHTTTPPHLPTTTYSSNSDSTNTQPLTCWQQSGDSHSFFSSPLQSSSSQIFAGSSWELILHQKFPETTTVNDSTVKIEITEAALKSILSIDTQPENVIDMTGVDNGYIDSRFGPNSSILFSQFGPNTIAEFGPNTIAEFGPNSIPEFGPNTIAEFGPNSIPEFGPNTIDEILQEYGL